MGHCEREEERLGAGDDGEAADVNCAELFGDGVMKGWGCVSAGGLRKAGGIHGV